MHADDAADLVGFCNGPSASFWGRKRDSILTAYALAPGPLDVRYFEIGNETYGKHKFRNSWTAMHPAKYFLGGEAERRGAVSTTVNGQRLHIPLGDLFGIRQGDSGATALLRFLQSDDNSSVIALTKGTCDIEGLRRSRSGSSYVAG